RVNEAMAQIDCRQHDQHDRIDAIDQEPTVCAEADREREKEHAEQPFDAIVMQVGSTPGAAARAANSYDRDRLAASGAARRLLEWSASRELVDESIEPDAYDPAEKRPERWNDQVLNGRYGLSASTGSSHAAEPTSRQLTSTMQDDVRPRL